jgi:diguanylate cyclase (GGDEF)-like protein
MNRTSRALVWVFNAFLGGLALYVLARYGGDAKPLLNPPHVGSFSAQWWMLIPIAAVAEFCMFSVQYRADAQTFSFGEITTVFGLAFLSPHHFLIAQTIGLVVPFLVRKTLPIRATFNLANSGLSAALAVAVTRSLVPDRPDGRSGGIWIAILLSIAITAPVQSLMIAVVRSVAERKMLFSDARRMAMFAQLNALAVATMGVVVAVVFDVIPIISATALVPLLLIYLFCGQVVREYTLRTNIEFLYDTAQTIHETPDVERALSTVLDRARTSFRASYASVLLRRSDTEGWLSFSEGETTGGAVLDRAPDWIPESSEAHILGGVRLPELSGKTRDGQERLMTQLGASNAMVATLRDGDVIHGMFIVADRGGGVIGFSETDRRLFTRLASQIAIGIQNSHLERSLGALTRLEEEMRHQANHDSLTGLANRTQLSEVLKKPSETNRSILLIDLDDFKTINDSLGHAAGDEVLVHVARCLRQSVRHDDLVARLGGDEFAVVLSSRHSAGGAESCADGIAAALSAPVTIAGRHVEIRCSIGIAIAEPGTDITDVLRNADVAMYQAKQSGKGRHRVFEAGMDREARERLQIISGLRHAIARQQMQLAYQPIVDLETGEVIAVEALARWNHAELGRLGPDRFIPIAEESGLIVELGAWNIRQSCLDIVDLRTPAGDPIELHVNVSPEQFSFDGFVETVLSALETANLDPARLVLEITERTSMTESEQLTTNVEQLRQAGVRLALDDFGTGYSSLAAAHNFPLDLIKIDQLFVRSLGHNEDRSLVRAIVALADSLNLSSVAEGVETEAQRRALLDLGCKLGQGYLFSKAVSIEELETNVSFQPLSLEPSSLERSSLEPSSLRPVDLLEHR